jgi:hypothetical protein
LASKKGIALTAAIAAAIIGGSFLIWFIPQSSPSGVLLTSPMTDEGRISDVYSRHHNIAASIDSKYDQWKKNNATANELVNLIQRDRSEIQNMKNELVNAKPGPEWQQSFDRYIKALDSYINYINTIDTKVQSGNKTVADPELDSQRQQWQGYVNDSVNAMQISK